MDLVLYSTGCPRCKVLEKKLKDKAVEYSLVSDVDAIMSRGITQVPVLEKEGKLLSFSEANAWVNSL